MPDRQAASTRSPTCSCTASAATATPPTWAWRRSACSANAYGLLAVNEHFQTSHPHIYAVGDVIGYPALASTSMEQGRQAMRHAFGITSVLADTEALPFAIYAIPEVSYVGATEEELQEQGVPYVVGRGRYEMNPRGQIIGDTEGVLKLLCEADSGRLLGVHIVGHRGHRAGPHRPGVHALRRHRQPDRRVALQLPDAGRPLPPRGAASRRRGSSPVRRPLPQGLTPTLPGERGEPTHPKPRSCSLNYSPLSPLPC